MIVQEFSGFAVVSGRYGTTAGDKQFVFSRYQISLRRHAGKGRTAVRLHKVRRTAAAVGPDNIRRLGVDCMNKGTHKRPDAGCEVYCIVVQHRTAPHGPHANQPVVADYLVCRRACEELLYQRTILGV